MINDVLAFWLIHLILGLLIPIEIYCCQQEKEEKEAQAPSQS